MDASGSGKPVRSTLRFDDAEAAKRGCYDQVTRFGHSPKAYPAWEVRLIVKRHWFSRGTVMEYWRGTTSQTSVRFSLGRVTMEDR
jgi:hypothetical protein